MLKIHILIGISKVCFLYENLQKFETVEFRSRKLSSFQKKSSKLGNFWIIFKLSTDNGHKKWWFCISLGFHRSPRPPKLFTNHFCGLSTVVKCNPDQYTKDMLHQIKQTMSILVVSQQSKNSSWSKSLKLPIRICFKGWQVFILLFLIYCFHHFSRRV